MTEHEKEFAVVVLCYGIVAGVLVGVALSGFIF